MVEMYKQEILEDNTNTISKLEQLQDSKVIISIPAYNEEEHIVGVIRDIKRVMSKTKYDYQILVIDDGSKDRTKEMAMENGAYVVSNGKNLGLAETFCKEMELCRNLKADVIVHTDADGQYPAIYIPFLIKKIEDGCDLALGSRFCGGSYSGPLSKKIGNIAFAKIFSLLLRIKISDTTTGFRAFKSSIARFPILSKFTYTQEQLIRAAKADFKIGEIHIKTNRTRKSRLFNHIFDYAIRALKTLLKLFKVYLRNSIMGKKKNIN